MNDQSNVPALKSDIRAAVREYEEKAANIEAAVMQFDEAVNAIESAQTLRGRYVGSAFSRGRPSVYAKTMHENLKKSAWREAFHMLQVDRIAPAADRQKFEREIEQAPDFTMDNLIATFGAYIEDPGHHILRGLAECFANLDPAFRSHSKVKIGVKGLPKRMIITNVSDWGSFGYDRLKDMLNAVRVFQGRAMIEPNELRDLIAMASLNRKHIDKWMPGARYSGGAIVEREGNYWKCRGGQFGKDEFEVSEKLTDNGWYKLIDHEPDLTLKHFQNGNMHIHFAPAALADINRAIAEFYGDVLPDVDPETGDVQPTTGSTAVARDLQFYRTPAAVVGLALRQIDVGSARRIFEPSCGDGAILDAMREQISTQAKVFGMELHAGRAAAARAKGWSVQKANFLDAHPWADMDLIVMNPPFYGLHWKKHFDHARKFLKPRDPEQRYGRAGAGTLVAILPATAWYDGHLDGIKGEWHDLPTASFAESGTNVPTGYFITWGE